MTKEQINEKTKKAQQAFSEWKTDIQKRADHIHEFAHELRKNKEELAKKVTKEMGKTVKEARSEIDKCIGLWNILQTMAESFYMMKSSIQMLGNLSSHLNH